jgi:hypothetical protein
MLLLVGVLFFSGARLFIKIVFCIVSSNWHLNSLLLTFIDMLKCASHHLLI